MKRLLGLLSPVALALAVGCGGGSSLDDIVSGATDPTVATTADPGADDGAADDDEPLGRGDDSSDTDTTTSTTPTTVASPPSGDAEAYCRLVRSFEDSADELDAALDSFTFDPDEIREAFAESQRALAELGRAAPPELRDDIALAGDAFGRLFAELEAVDFNFFALDFLALEELFEGLDEAGERIDEYHERVCGIPRGDLDDLDDAFGDLGELGDLDDLEELFGEMGDLFGDLEDFDFGDFGGMFTEILVDEYVSQGYTEAEARCLAEASLDFEALFGALGDPDSFEDFQDPFERCGVTPRD